MKSIWGFDMDEVLCDFSSYLVEVTNGYFGTNIQCSDLKHYYVDKTIGKTVKEFAPVMEICSRYENIVSRSALLNGVTALRAIKSRGCPVHIITSRGEDIRPATEAWLKKNDVPYDELIMTSYQSKLIPIKKLGIDHFVDDHPNHAKVLGEAGINVFVPKYPWNDWHEYPHSVRMIDCVSHVLDLIDENGTLKKS